MENPNQSNEMKGSNATSQEAGRAKKKLNLKIEDGNILPY
jgi:hypothetical protein